MAELILSKRQAERAIKNFKERIKRIGQGYGNKEAGILYSAHRLFEQVDEAVRTFSVQVVGSAIEEVADDVNFEEPWLYYASRFDSGRDREQEDFVEDFIEKLNEFSEELQDEIEAEEEEKESETSDQEGLEDEYRRELKNLKSLIKRRTSRGIDVPYSNIVTPKKITAGSVRKVLKAIESIKTNYPL